MNALFEIIDDVDFTTQSKGSELNLMIGFTELIDLKDLVSQRSFFLVPFGLCIINYRDMEITWVQLR